MPGTIESLRLRIGAAGALLPAAPWTGADEACCRRLRPSLWAGCCGGGDAEEPGVGVAHANGLDAWRCMAPCCCCCWWRWCCWCCGEGVRPLTPLPLPSPPGPPPPAPPPEPESGITIPIPTGELAPPTAGAAPSKFSHTMAVGCGDAFCCAPRSLPGPRPITTSWPSQLPLPLPPALAPPSDSCGVQSASAAACPKTRAGARPIPLLPLPPPPLPPPPAAAAAAPSPLL